MSGSLAAVVAHPDDESLISGGTLALAARGGARTGAVSLTRGEEGPISDPALATHETLGDVREQELGAAASALRLAWSACLDLPDGKLPWVDHEQAARSVTDLLAPHRPSVLLTFGEDGLYGHADHAAAGRIAHLVAGCLEAQGADPVAVYEAAWPAGLVAALAVAARARNLPSGLWGLDAAAFGAEGGAATSVLDVADVLPRKLTALRAHRTQVGDDHLLAALPDDLARRYLSEEPWRLARGPAGALEALVRRGRG